MTAGEQFRDTGLEESLEKLRQQIGEPFVLEQYNHVATADAVRHFALGYGDDNPLWCDPDRASSSPFGGLIAPPGFVMTCGFPRARGLPGVHSLFAGATIEYDRPLRVGEAVQSEAWLESLEEKQGSYAGLQFKQDYKARYLVDDECVATLLVYTFRTSREVAGSRKKYGELIRRSYSRDEIAELQLRYREERRRVATPSPGALDGAEVGMTLPTLVKGPLTVGEIILWIAGAGTVYVQSSRQWFGFIDRHPKAGVWDDYGVPDSPERVHWDDGLAGKIGMPGPYDYGSQRVAWLGNVVTDWIGEAGWVRRLSAQVVGPNYVGDLTELHGQVRAIDPESGELTIDLHGEDQRGRTTVWGQAVVARSPGPTGATTGGRP